MRQILLLPLAALLAMPVFSQTPADTTLTIRNIEIQGTRFAGLSERGGMKILRVDNNLSSVTNTAADAFRQLPSVITDMEGAVHTGAPVMSGCLSMEFLTVCWKNIAVTC